MSPAPLVTFAIAYSPAPPGPWGYSSYLCVHQPDHDSLCLQKNSLDPAIFSFAYRRKVTLISSYIYVENASPLSKTRARSGVRARSTANPFSRCVK